MKSYEKVVATSIDYKCKWLGLVVFIEISLDVRPLYLSQKSNLLKKLMLSFTSWH